MEGYVKEQKKLDALAEAMRLVSEEFASTRDGEVAAAGHVLSKLIVQHVQALDRELDKILQHAGL